MFYIAQPCIRIPRIVVQFVFMRPPFRPKDQSNITQLIGIHRYRTTLYFIRSLAIRNRRIQL